MFLSVGAFSLFSFFFFFLAENIIDFVDPNQDHHHVIRQDYVNRRGIYKDTYGSVTGWTDYQLRPNFLVAMVVAPELFSRENAKHAVEIAEKLLAGPLGMKTLDPGDYNYRGNYDNANDGDDRSIAKGFNYHQGPVNMRTLLIRQAFTIFLLLLRNGCGAQDFFSGLTFASWGMGSWMMYEILWQNIFSLSFLTKLFLVYQALLNKVRRRLQIHRRMLLEQSVWAALPELTNESGSECRDSCPSQAWSFATILDTMFDLYLIAQKTTIKS
jgi:glycogen debranching enzyme